MSTELRNSTRWIRTRYASMVHRCRELSVIQSLRSAGPYLLVELLLPGGTLMALALYVYRNRRVVARAALPHATATGGVRFGV